MEPDDAQRQEGLRALEAPGRDAGVSSLQDFLDCATANGAPAQHTRSAPGQRSQDPARAGQLIRVALPAPLGAATLGKASSQGSAADVHRHAAAASRARRAFLVLAAGSGRRFGGTQHKALVPLTLGEGSLQRLLRQLGQLAPGTPICVAVGPRAAQIRAAIPAHPARIHEVCAAGRTRASLLTSVAAGLERLGADPMLDGAWVCFADTLYHPQALLQLIQSDGADPLVAIQPADASTGGDRIGVVFDPITRRLLDLGPEAPMHQGVMAPAVYWPRSCWSALTQAASQGLALQWEVLREQRHHGRIRVVPLGHGQTRDMDTSADHDEARRLLVDPLAVAVFRHTISKEERNLELPDQVSGSAYHKVCGSEELADREALAIDWLHQAPGCRVPALLDRKGRTLFLEPIRGIRLYDLLRLLRHIAPKNPELATEARSASRVLLRRGLEQLLPLQRALLAWPLAAEQPAYPLSSKVTGLLATLLRLLGLPSLQPEDCRELRALDRRWQASDAVIPFRDATAKNSLVVIPELAPGTGCSPAERIRRLEAWLTRRESDSVPLVDFDFTSVVHRTAPEDDLFSLMAHAGSLPVAEPLLADLVPGVLDWPSAVAELVGRIDPGIRPDRGRAARALLVRYLRFGGRKLLYRILNPAAFSVRFRYDDPTFYFLRLPDLLSQLDPDFEATFPLLFARLNQLRQTARLLPPWSAAEAGQDLYQSRLGRSIRYWQESPLESPGGVSASLP